MDELRQFIQETLDYLNANRGSLSPQDISKLESILSQGFNQLEAMERPPKPSNDATLLWILSGGNKDAFVNYLSQANTPETNELLRNPALFDSTMQQLEQFNPREGIRDSADGIPISPLQSSNVYGSKYDPQSGKLKVRFQEGQVYEYDDVPPMIAQLFQAGAATAKTKGQNRFGRWWKSKSPSIGSAVHKYLIGGGYGYKRVA